MGTLLYMAPEQVNCCCKEWGPATDVFSLGVIMYELLCGCHPFQTSSTLALLENVRDGRCKPIPRELAIPIELQQIIKRCLQSDIDLRYPTAELLRNDLDRFNNDQPISGYRLPIGRSFLRWCQRSERITQAAAAAAVAHGAVLLGLFSVVAFLFLVENSLAIPIKELSIDSVKLAAFPHVPVLITSWLILRGKLHLQWLNLAIAIFMILLMAYVLTSGESPVRAYRNHPFAFLMSHMIILSISVSVLIIQLLAIPASIKTRKQRIHRHPTSRFARDDVDLAITSRLP